MKTTRKKPSAAPSPRSEASDALLDRLAQSDVLEMKAGALPSGRRRRPANENARESDHHQLRCPRVELAVEVGIDDHTNFYVGFSENVSAGGLFVSTLRLLPVGSAVALMFVLPDGIPLFVQGSVRWLREPAGPDGEPLAPGLGIEFVNLGVTDQASVEAYLEGRAPLYPPD